MVARIIVTLGLIVLAGGFIFFAANVIWLGMKEFFKQYGPKSKAAKKELLKETQEASND